MISTKVPTAEEDYDINFDDAGSKTPTSASMARGRSAIASSVLTFCFRSQHPQKPWANIPFKLPNYASPEYLLITNKVGCHNHHIELN